MDLNRFLSAQEGVYQDALKEIISGKKRTHWMWFIFPQIQGLGRSETAQYYAIRDLTEARAFIDHPVLGSRLKEMASELLKQTDVSAHDIFGSPDDLKLHSCMTLFSLVSDDPVFTEVLNHYYKGQPDISTLRICCK